MYKLDVSPVFVTYGTDGYSSFEKMTIKTVLSLGLTLVPKGLINAESKETGTKIKGGFCIRLGTAGETAFLKVVVAELF